MLLSAGALVACDTVVPIGRYDTVLDAAANVDGDAASAADADSDSSGALSWSADHEPATLEEWTEDGGGYTYAEGEATLAVTETRPHEGQYGIEVTSSPPMSGELVQAVVARRVTLREGEYSAWYYFPESPDTDHFVIMKLSSTSDGDRFDIDIHAPMGGTPHLRLFEHGVGWITEPAPVPLPIGRWVRISASLVAADTDEGRLVILQDDTPILDIGARATMPSEDVTWLVGAACRYVSPAPYTFFIDDVWIRAPSR